MRCAAAQLFVLLLLALPAGAETEATAAPVAEKRSWMNRVVHPFSGPSSPPSQLYQDTRLRGLDLAVQISPNPVKLSEVRQLEVRVTLSNHAKHAIELTFPTDQRIDIFLLSQAGNVLTKWSENRSFVEKQSIVLLNPRERIEYSETIATRELTAGKVFSVEVFFPQYPELKIRQKFLAAP